MYRSRLSSRKDSLSTKRSGLKKRQLIEIPEEEQEQLTTSSSSTTSTSTSSPHTSSTKVFSPSSSSLLSLIMIIIMDSLVFHHRDDKRQNHNLSMCLFSQKTVLSVMVVSYLKERRPLNLHQTIPIIAFASL